MIDLLSRPHGVDLMPKGRALVLSLIVGLLLAVDCHAQGLAEEPSAEEVPRIERTQLELLPISRENVVRVEEVHSEKVRVTSFAWRPDGSQLVGNLNYRDANEEGVEVRDGATFEVLGTAATGRRVSGFTFNPKRPQAGWVTQDGKVELLNMETGDGFFLDDVGRSPNLVFRPDGAQFAVGGQAGTIRVCSADSGATLHTLEATRARYLIQPFFSPDGKWIAVAPVRGSYRVWDSETGELKKELEITQNLSTLVAFFDPKSERLFAIQQGGKLTIWNPQTGEKLKELDMEAQAPSGARWIAEGQILVTIGPGIVAFWNGDDLSLLLELDAPRIVSAFSVSPDGRRLIAVGRDPPENQPMLHVWGVPAVSTKK